MSALSAVASANSQQRKSSHHLNPNWQILVTLCHKLKSLPDRIHTDYLHESTEPYLTHIHLNIYIINSNLSHIHGTVSLFLKECHLSTLSDWLLKVWSHQEVFWQFFLFPLWTAERTIAINPQRNTKKDQICQFASYFSHFLLIISTVKVNSYQLKQCTQMYHQRHIEDK